MLKLLFRTALLLTVSVSVFLLLLDLLRTQANTVRSAPALEQIQNLATLVTVKVDVADVMVTEVRGYTGGMRVAALIKGDYLLGTDLGRARFDHVDFVKHKAVLLLPLPVVRSLRLDPDRTQLFAIRDFGLWRI